MNNLEELFIKYEKFFKYVNKNKNNYSTINEIEIKIDKNKYKNIDFNNLTEENITTLNETLEVRDIPYTISQELLDDFRNRLKERINNSYNNYLSQNQKDKFL